MGNVQNNLFPVQVLEKKRADYEYLDSETKDKVEKSYESFRLFFGNEYPTIQQKLTGQKGDNEAQTRKILIDPLLEILGYHNGNMSVEESLTNQGNTKKLDYFAYSTMEALGQFRKLEPFASDDFVLIEAKEFTKPLDNKKSSEDNPHFQLIRYAGITGIPNGILTNGHTFRFYDNSRRYAQKTFYEITLDEIASYTTPARYYAYFYSIFAYTQLVRQGDKESVYEGKTKKAIQSTTQALKDRISSILYGVGEYSDSVIEKVGEAIYRIYPDKPLKEIFHNSLIFIFRILFMASYETKHQEILKEHTAYPKYSLLRFMKKQMQTSDKDNAKDSMLWKDLLVIFGYLNEGNGIYNIPMLNGGLFSPHHAPLLQDSRLFDNALLWEILSLLLIDTTQITPSTEPLGTFYDFKSLDTLTFGEIYEVSLGYDFRIAQETTYLVQYTQNNTLITKTLDHMDYHLANQNRSRYQNFKETKEYKPSQIYLTSLSGERKNTGSYYTPEVFSTFLVKQGIDKAIQNGKNPLDIKILDNSCGSGHFLIYALYYLTSKVQDILADEQSANAEERTKILEQVQEEKVKITQNITKIFSSHTQKCNAVLLEETADEKILRRLILKRCLFGVDLQEIAVEITMISLWMETFIFATPLSFIEHHIKVGNSLIYTSIQNVASKEKKAVGMFSVVEKYKDDLRDLLDKISKLQDTSTEEIKKSKDMFYGEALPKMVEISAIFDFYTYQEFVLIMSRKDKDRMVASSKHHKLQVNRWQEEIKYLKKNGEDLDTIVQYLVYIEKERDSVRFNSQVKKANGSLEKIRDLVMREEWKTKLAEIKTEYPWFLPFHTEIQFPDVPGGFDVVTGNPPWDIVQFEEDAFYSNLDTSYRTQKHSGKLEIRERYESTAWVQKWVQKEKTTSLYNTYLQEKFPLCRGGKGNLFRYFIARNLSLMAPMGTLSYITPSAIMMEDASTTLRKHLLENYTMNYFYQFENKGKFASIHNQFKFALWQIQNQKPKKDYTIQTRFLQNDVSFLHDTQTFSLVDHDGNKIVDHDGNNLVVVTDTDIASLENTIPYSFALVQKLSPDHWRFLEFKAPIELEIVKRAQSIFPPLAEDYINFQQELNMTFNKNLFQELHLDGSFDKAWRKEELLPVYEGKMIHQYQAQYAKSTQRAKPTYWVEREALEQKLKRRVLPQSLKKLSLQEEQALLEKADWDYHHIRLAFRTLARNTDKRTVISSLIPERVTFSEKLWAGVGLSLAQILFLQSVFNSLTFDFLARLFVELTVSKSIIMRLPCPQPPLAQLNEKPYKTLVQAAAQLQVLHNPGIFPEIEKQFAIDPKKHLKTKDARDKLKTRLRIQIDVLVAQLYQVSAKEMEYILTTFPVFHRDIKTANYGKFLLEAMKPTTPNNDTAVEYDF